jgi:hypothetical protein
MLGLPAQQLTDQLGTLAADLDAPALQSCLDYHPEQGHAPQRSPCDSHGSPQQRGVHAVDASDNEPAGERMSGDACGTDMELSDAELDKPLRSTPDDSAGQDCGTDMEVSNADLDLGLRDLGLLDLDMCQPSASGNSAGQDCGTGMELSDADQDQRLPCAPDDSAGQDMPPEDDAHSGGDHGTPVCPALDSTPQNVEAAQDDDSDQRNVHSTAQVADVDAELTQWNLECYAGMSLPAPEHTQLAETQASVALGTGCTFWAGIFETWLRSQGRSL